jgi:hypothetical protein
MFSIFRSKPEEPRILAAELSVDGAGRLADTTVTKQQALRSRSRTPQQLEGYMEIDPQEGALRAYKRNARASMLRSSMRWFS